MALTFLRTSAGVAWPASEDVVISLRVLRSAVVSFSMVK
jgi:hypothetical protein